MFDLAFIDTLMELAEGLSIANRSSFAILLMLVGSVTSIFAASTATVSLQSGVAGYNGARDTKLLNGTPTTNYGTATGLELDGSPGVSALLSWNLASIPLGSIIQSVDITVNVTNTSTQTYEIYEMKRPWVEGEATWNAYASGLNWQVAGADGAGDRGTTELGALTSASTGLKTFSLNASGVALVQSWVNNPSSNHGFIILDYISTNGLDFSSRENGTVANRPKLTITYVTDGQPVLAINDVTVTEGNTGAVDATFTVSLSPASTQAVTVDYTTADGSATTAGSDYVAVSGQVSFQPGQTSQPVTVVVNGDVLDEPNETFSVNLSNAVNATIGDNQGAGTITNDDATPSLSINDVTVTEGNSGTVNAVFAVTLFPTSSQTVTVDFTTADGSATAGSDYAAVSGQVSFSPGQTSQPVTVVVNGDVVDEPNETFSVNLSNAVNATISDNQGAGTITNDDATSLLSINDIVVTEGNSGTVNAVFAVTLFPTSSQTVTVDFTTADGSATAGGDYVTVSGQVSFSPGQTSRSVTVVVNGDVLDEPNETFFVNLSNAANAGFGDNQGIGTISNDDGSSLPGQPITFSATGDIPYGSSELPELERIVHDHNLYSPSEFFVHVGDLNAGTEACNHQRYLDVANILKTLEVPAFIVLGDNEWTDCSNPSQALQWWKESFTDFENNFCGAPAVEHQAVRHENWAFVSKGVLFVGINIPNGNAPGGEGSGRLQDDANWVTAQFQQKVGQVRAAVVFGHSGPASSRDAFFNPFVSASTTFGKPVIYIQGDTHSWKLDQPWSAPNMQRLVVPRGGKEDPPQITVTMNMSNPFSMIRKPWSNNPTPINRGPCGAAGPALTINDVTVTEGNSGTVNAVFSVTLSAASSQTVTVNYATANGTATAGSDYAAVSGQVSFSPGQTSRPVTVVVNGDVIGEPNETFFVNLSNAANATIGDNQGAGAITNDDAPALAINDMAVSEGNSGTVNAVFSVTLSTTTSQTVTVDFTTADGSATAGSDYAAVSGQVSFSPGQISRPVTVVVNGDVLDEPNETFAVNLSNAVNATIGDGQGIGTITNDDGPPSVAINNVAVTEGNSGTVNAVFSVTLSKTVSQAVTVDYTTADGSATTAGSDYVAVSGQVSFSPGQTSQPVTVVVNGDVLDEPNETFFVNLSNAANATIGDNQGAGTITNDDGVQQPVTVSFQNGVGGYTGTLDTKLMSGTATTNYGSTTPLQVDGSPDISTLLSWNLTSIPSGSTIQSVGITVNVSDSTGETYEIYEMKRSWVEGQATWNVFASGQSWQVAGGNGSADRGSTVLGAITSPNTGSKTFSLNSAGVAMVQSWVNSPSSNHGFIILDYGASKRVDFASREHATVANRPKLTVTYTGTSPAKVSLSPMPESEATAPSAAALPQTVALNPNYPNPFNLETRIEYALPEQGLVSVAIYNVRGQQVRELVDEIQSGGFKSVLWNGRDDSGQEVGSGVYFIRLIVGQQSFVRRVALQK